LKEMRNLRNQP